MGETDKPLGGGLESFSSARKYNKEPPAPAKRKGKWEIAAAGVLVFLLAIIALVVWKDSGPKKQEAGTTSAVTSHRPSKKKAEASSSSSTSSSSEPSTSNRQALKSNTEIAAEIIRSGDWGNGQDRINRLTKAGYDVQAIQAIVNQEMGQ